MNTQLIRSRKRHAHLAALALLGVMTGCSDPDTATFDAAASRKIAAEKGLRPGGLAKERGKVLGPGGKTTETGRNSFRKL
jgi:hypothetical protein